MRIMAEWSLVRIAAMAAAFLAASPLPSAAEPGDIKGQDAIGDKAKSAHDGWSQAPVPREQSAGKDASDPGGKSSSDKPGSPGAGAKGGSALGNGSDDPAKPLDHRMPGPSGQNPASPSK
jgi:hypothetical protein